MFGLLGMLCFLLPGRSEVGVKGVFFFVCLFIFLITFFWFHHLFCFHCQEK